MQYNIIVREALGLPYPEQGIGVQQVAVNGKGNVGAAGYMVFADIGTKPALKPSAFIVIGAGAFAFEFVPGLEAVDKKITDIFSGLWKTFYQFLKF